MPDHFDLADFREPLDTFAAMVGAQRLRRIDRRTSNGGNSNARFPGDDFSKIKPSF